MISGQKLSRTFVIGQNETHALSNVDFSAKDGEFVAIIGKSGAGKSTLMYQLSLLDTPTHGSVTINGINTSTLSPNERTKFRLAYLGYVFQDYALVPELTAEENVLLPLLMRGEQYGYALKKSRATLESLGLGHRLDRRPGRLSGGEQQRVSIARAITHEPLILFADEPTANLDTESSKQLLSHLEDMHKRGQTIIMVTHELDYAARAQCVLELSDGKVTREGTPQELNLLSGAVVR